MRLWTRYFCVFLFLVVPASISVSARAEWTWTNVLTEDFGSDPSWNYSGTQNGGGQNLIRYNSSGYVDAEWDQSNSFSGSGDPYTIVPSRYSKPLGQTLNDTQTFKFGGRLRINSIADTSEFYQAANFGLYGLANMGSDRLMSDNGSGNTTLMKDGSDFVEWNYFINNNWGGRSTQPTIGAHINGGDPGDYITGSGSDGKWHNTAMGDGSHQLPTYTDLYVEVIYYGSATNDNKRRAYGAVYTDPERTTLLSVNGVEQYYWTVGMNETKSFSLTDFAFYNYVGSNWGGANGSGSGTFDDVYVAVNVPEPATITVLMCGLAGCLVNRRRKRIAAR
jgi:hypothetical protein